MIAYCGLCVSSKTQLRGIDALFCGNASDGNIDRIDELRRGAIVKVTIDQAAVDTGIGAEDLPAFHRQPVTKAPGKDAREGCPLQPTRSDRAVAPARSARLLVVSFGAW